MFDWDAALAVARNSLSALHIGGRAQPLPHSPKLNLPLLLPFHPARHRRRVGCAHHRRQRGALPAAVPGGLTRHATKGCARACHCAVLWAVQGILSVGARPLLHMAGWASQPFSQPGGPAKCLGQGCVPTCLSFSSCHAQALMLILSPSAWHLPFSVRCPAGVQGALPHHPAPQVLLPLLPYRRHGGLRGWAWSDLA